MWKAICIMLKVVLMGLHSSDLISKGCCVLLSWLLHSNCSSCNARPQCPFRFSCSALSTEGILTEKKLQAVAQSGWNWTETTSKDGSKVVPGPSTEPWGTPWNRGETSDNRLLAHMRTGLLERYEENHETPVPEIPTSFYSGRNNVIIQWIQCIDQSLQPSACH